MRYNDQQYLEQWRASRAFPRIHDAIFDACVQWMPDLPFVDLCGSTGLLGRRIHDVLGLKGCGIDADTDAITRGLQAGVYGDDLPIRHQLITPDTLPDMSMWLRDHNVQTVVARRCFCVISEKCPLPLVQDLFLDLGVTTIILEGQKRDGRAVHPVGSADQQAEAFDRFTVRFSARDVRVLTR